MPDLKKETAENLLSLFLNAAAQLNGNASETTLDGGAGALRRMESTLAEITARYKADKAALEKAAGMTEFLKIMAGIEDISNLRKIADEVKHLPIPEYAEIEPRKEAPRANPFRNNF